jgi:hypothetical protein
MAVLSHYTNRRGLEGIAKSKTLWASNFLDLNDKTEMIFAFVELSKAGLRKAEAECRRLMKPGEGGILDYDAAALTLAEFYRSSFGGHRASEHLHVTSFAQSTTADHARRGILTLWSRYTQNEGYCLQYDEDEVRQLLKREENIRSYALIDLIAVEYGVVEHEAEFNELRNQLALRYLGEVYKAKRGLNIDPRFEEWWPLPDLATRMMRYAATHKDAFFEDEREMRITALPVTAVALPFGDGKRSKVLRSTPAKRYIDLGEDWAPAIEPIRIIVGPNSAKNIDHVLVQFDRRPEVDYPSFPIIGL